MKRKLLFLLLFISVISRLTAQNELSEQLLKQHVYTLAADSMFGRGIGSKESQKSTGYIIQQFKNIGLKPYKPGNYIHEFKIKDYTSTVYGYNLIGVIEGSDPVLKNEFIVIGAHYDHLGYEESENDTIIYNGADDNASGTSMLIEIARELIKNNSKIKRSIIIVAFDGEESGLYGSRIFLRDTIFPIKDIKAMYSFDMVGMLSANEGLNMKGVTMLEGGLDFFNPIAEKYDLELFKTGNSYENRTDTEPFGNFGIPAFSPTTGENSPYHQPEDDADLLDYEGMVTVGNFLLESVIELANKETIKSVEVVEEIPEYNDIFVPKVKTFALGIRLNTGAGRLNYYDDFYKGKNLFAVQAGFYAKIKLSKYFFLQPEILYSTTASKTAIGNMRIHSVNAPLGLLMKISDSPMYISIGGFYDYSFAGKQDKKDMDYENTFNKENYGYFFSFLLDADVFWFGFTRTQGFTNIYKNETLGKAKTENIFFTLGIPVK